MSPASIICLQKTIGNHNDFASIKQFDQTKFYYQIRTIFKTVDFCQYRFKIYTR